MLGKWSFFSVISFHTCAVTVVTKQTRTMNVIETAKRVVFLTADTYRISLVSAESSVSENILIFGIGHIGLRLGYLV